ncbi:hypothetical protein P153DRAFT_427572 [Dothidotthia symphoricarpi CBS 119687]|uniref:Uncharacterized protein n=1 Tax=Dothidotthia symphoricarpi CBS 119687 TaxID=1392245 RepID=A0A6A6AW12_9PLEO|nr:uncharacterized protein P153DRAFT_427572 [Dothidotthia symphoricarpi CBS 119687]KAF2134997.1 hypothetical protein P153DRAFT_427572 [Dothidotthia symphoricarpi CBS 119687]
MRTVFFFLTLATLVLSLNLTKTDGTMLELSGTPGLVNLSGVILPEPGIDEDKQSLQYAAREPTSTTSFDTGDVASANDDEDCWGHDKEYCRMLHFYEHNRFGGRVSVYQSCIQSMNTCRETTGDLSSIKFKNCPRGTPNFRDGQAYYCFFYDTKNCDNSRAGLYLPGRGEFPHLGQWDWNDRIRSFQCFWDS